MVRRECRKRIKRKIGIEDRKKKSEGINLYTTFFIFLSISEQICKGKKMTIFYTLLPILIEIVRLINCSGNVSFEKLLINDLMTEYKKWGKSGRPVRNISTVSNVSFSLGLIQMDLNEKDKVLTMSMWTRYVWNDEYLTWNPKDYGGVTTIRLSADSIWKPDIMLYNTADVDSVARQALAVIRYDGSVSWFPHTIFRSSCSLDVTNFPFDNQSCHMWFGSWTHPSDQINLTMLTENGIDLSTFQSDFKDGSGWDIYKVHAERQVKGKDNVPKFTIVTFELYMRRKMVFSSYILTLPCVFLACLTLVVFWLPPDRPDRTSLAMSIFGSFMVLLLILVEAAPPTAGSIPNLGVYYCFNVVIIMFSIILSSLVVNINRGGNECQYPPKWLNLITLGCLARAMCMRGKCTTRNIYSATNEKSHERIELFNDISELHDFDVDRRHLSDFEKQLYDLRRIILRFEQKLEERNRFEKEKTMAKKSWQRIATVLDRFFFILYLVLIITSLSLLFPRPV
ncbi:DgyrCDS3084 [Dimorphilus gyrociliatus]|uniref:DgyrCDS3084 n=1 Tax=Dimorphilus gyrociliatus TaxID=2664684 RepID=A0A7I8VEW6_9ANNE|nr:DgyrCDS3084 [Dimorphilus gyrociliatus]